MKRILNVASAVALAVAISAPAFANEQADSDQLDFDFCKLLTHDNAKKPSLRDIKSGFESTGYIAAEVCFPQPRNTWLTYDEFMKIEEASNRSAEYDIKGVELAGHYTRWIVEPADDVTYKDGHREYSMEGRHWIKRLFTDRVIDTAHFLEISMSAPDVSFSIPLSTFKYNEEGERGIEYTTSFRQHAFNQTYFRVDSNTTSNIVARARHSSKTSFSGIAEALSAVQNVITLVAPTSTLLTSINAEQVTNTSTAINSVASSLFSNSYDEKVEDGFTLADWFKHRKVLIIVQFPFEVTSHRRNKGGRSDNEDAIYKAFWLSLACPRPSIFSPLDECEKGQDFTPTIRSVLNFQMAANTTVQQHLAAQQWYKDFLTSPVIAGKAKKGEDAATKNQIIGFCRNIDNEFYKAGFNDGDAKLIKYSAIRGMPELAKASSKIDPICLAEEDADSPFKKKDRAFLK